jgi:hypothetical protein
MQQGGTAMNRTTVLASITASLCAALALVSAPALAAKPVGGGSTACTTAGDFPAFAFWRSAGRTIEILVADATGKCVRSVIKSSGTGGTIQFSYPVAGTGNRGRIAWVAAPSVVSVDFTVDSATKNVTVFAKKTIYSGTGGFISLSKEGNALYSTRYPSPGGPVVERVPLDTLGSPTGSPILVWQAPDGSNVQTISVNGDQTVLFADYKPTSGAAVNQLVWVLLASGTVYEIDSNSSWREFNPAADPSSNRVAYTRFEGTSGGCDALVTWDFNVSAAVRPAAYGLKPTWVAGNIVADGRTTTCDYSGTIVQTNPITGVQTALTSGYDPDGK